MLVNSGKLLTTIIESSLHMSTYNIIIVKRCKIAKTELYYVSLLSVFQR
jgi:hypothetical protein